jgi:predicted transposase/invertase (TIGR01784 family)
MYRIHPSVYEKADPALLELIEKAKVGNLSEEEYLRYEAGLKALEDYIDFDEMLAEAQAKVAEVEAKLEEAQAKAEEAQAKSEEAQLKAKTEGRAEGRAEGKIEVAKRMLNDNLSVELISKFTGLTQEELDNLRQIF